MLTGARLGELTFLKGEDVRMYEGHLCISLLDEEGVEAREEGRPLKTDESRRIIVLHDIIMRTGFPDWVAERRPDDWIWPRLHQRAAGAAIVRPAGAASKRQIRSMQAAGIHQPYTDVFHSLRHGAKDWHRDATVADRTSRLQIGHSFRDVDDSYGSKRLRQKEIDDLASLALPQGVDFGPYLIREEPLKDLPRKRWR
ncbi:hypothetical protein N177_4116 [Lutibaculum baratangense AMV1]|uniref:Tyr recombinase domain-containing protein n=2 Tax=Lutibaculum TaxID=1358438 RepID=V4R8P8_9HYPH|nr:hypothetical protein N177_4116 [Lutibaculum baratangense AMV1]